MSDTPDGVKLSRGLGFEEEPPAPGSTLRRFILDLETSDSPYAEEYQSALNTKVSQNGHQDEKSRETSISTRSGMRRAKKQTAE